MDLLDWLALFFGFQRDNVRNQREHLVLHLANSQMRLTPPPDNIDTLEAGVLRRFRKKLLKNYTTWCSYLGKKSNIWISDSRRGGDLRRELLYVSLYLLIWGEAANLRFMPECICYIFHNMANELNRILEDFIDENTGQPVMPSISGENAFLNFVVKPIYDTIKREVDSSRNGTAPHSAWRNYDDINEYFWSKRCFEKLKWPLDVGSNFFVTAGGGKHVGKTGFVEQRSFWNLFRSFDRLWVMLILFLQAAIIVAWEGKTYPWQALEDRTVQVRVLTIFFTWSGLRFLQSLLDVGMQYRLVSRETMGLAVRMVLKCVVAAGWIVVFGVFYARIWTQRNQDRRWSPAANNRVLNFMEAVFVFVIPELLALALFILPWIRNFVENTNWRVFYMLSWWFQSRSFVGRGLREGLVDNVKYSLFWIVVLATKFCFSYFLQVKPMIAPTKAVLGLKHVEYEWHEFFHNSNRFAVGLLWLPVVLIYLMDIQIWYSIYSSFVGAAVGLFSHLGEIRNMQQLKLRFQFFASAIQFNLMPEEQLLNTRGTLKSKFKDAIHRLKLRKLESNQIEANKFALIWNEIILSFREEDIISDKEFELLELPQNSWNVRVIRWPCFLLCNELLLALSQAKELVNDSDKRLYNKICKIEKMMAFSVLTPYYSEEVLYSKEQLRNENEDGVSILYYLQTIYDDEWKNFMERMRREGITKDSDIWTEKLRDLRLWASYRGQTLSRTVRGMMYYYRALKMLTFLDSASEMDIREGARELVSMRPDNLGSHEYGTALMKFTYVIACQIYGTQKEKKDPHADEILYLMQNNEALRVAYVDEKTTGRDEKEYYSVLVKYDQQLQKEVEIYRVKLPGPLKLGEGKPENQNHAIIFTRGDAVQTIDMNQDNYFEEALKMRNLLEEYSHYYGIRKPTILGVREHIFTGSVSSLAWFMSAQETSFVTLGQRVLANPLKVRMHYGHPDVFDRFWFLTRGGISKASRVINISEDIFAGFNCTLRGGNVTHHEYIQVGKGRDVGLNQVSMFEAKVASGNGEQILSRDVYRLGHRLDFFRMLSFFYTTVGFFFNTMMVILTVYAFLWGRLYLALSGVENAMESNSNNNKALGTILNQQFIIQLGLFTALPMIVENSLEHGFLQAIWDFLTMQLQLSSVFYTFSMGTRSHFFGRTVLHGGAKYRATGRGFVVEHKGFAEIYRLFSRSHFVKAIELGLILVIYASHSPVATDTFVYIALTITSWFLVASWIMAPFVFNPSGFDWLKTVYDFDDFMNWIWFSGSVFAKAEQSWERWWYEEQDHLKVTGLWGKLLEIILDLRFFFFQYGIVYQLGISDGSTSIAVYLLSWIYVLVVSGIYVVVVYARNKYAAREHIYYRLVQFLVIILAILVIVGLLEFTQFKFIDIFTSLLAFIPTGWGLISIAQVFRPFFQSTIIWDGVVSVARLYDIMFGVIVMVPVALLSWLPGFQNMQTRILFNEAFSRGLRIFQIVTGKKSQS
uniref:1,3-beta-glucan synthase n=1 Tax=Cajanus cajan TaxID=3821 RepID=A0A151RPU3_CAJCA|nr:Callose synthase 12 [Cajanus cajan]